MSGAARGQRFGAAGSAETGRRLWTALLAYTLAVVGIITLAPFRFGPPGALRIASSGQPFDVVANVALFLPLGALYRLARPDPTGRGGLHVLGLGLLTSGAIEFAQLFQSERFASPLDVLANALGAWAGAALLRRSGKRAKQGWTGRWSLELPLVGLLYLLVPLLWIDSLARGGLGFRLWLPFWLGLFGAALLGALQRHHFGPAGILAPRTAALVAAGGFLLGTAPGLPHWTAQTAVVALLVAGVAWHRGRARVPPGADRRYEIPALRAAAPLFGAYLFFLALAPLAGGTGAWGARLGFPAALGALSNVEQLRLLESVAAFTLLGFMVAEFRGRLELPFRESVGPILLWSGTGAGVVELLRGFRPGYGASATLFGMVLGAAAYGGWLYHLQRAHIRERVVEACRADATGRPLAARPTMAPR